jgi:cytochrome c oxidase assembly factor CtaG
MQPISEAVLFSWSIPPAATFALLLTTVIYLRGWILLRRARVPFVPPWRAASFLAGIVSLWVALASPCDTFSGFLLTAHMLQHMLLMMVVPPLILLGAPLIPLVRGVPVFAAREFAGPFLNWRVARRVGGALIHPAVALIVMGGVMFAWHTPKLYELALSSGAWHQVEHACFFFASLIFWWPVIAPWPSRSHRARWIVVPYLLIGDLQNTVLSAILVFSDRVLYPSYASTPRLFGVSALADQVASGALMWVMGSVVFLIPAMAIAVECLSKARPAAKTVTRVPEISLLEKLLTRASSPKFVRRRLSPGRAEAISFVVLFAAAGLCLASLASIPSDDDDQALRASQTAGPFLISVFALPGDLEVGSAELSVLVQDRDTLQVLRDADVQLQLQKTGASRATAPVRASNDDSENKLLQSAEVELPSEGDWELQVRVIRNGQSAVMSLPLYVVKGEGETTIRWPFIVFAAFSGILAFTYWWRHRLGTNVTQGYRSRANAV